MTDSIKDILSQTKETSLEYSIPDSIVDSGELFFVIGKLEKKLCEINDGLMKNIKDVLHTQLKLSVNNELKYNRIKTLLSKIKKWEEGE
jgi:hypothetical protein